MTSIPVVKFGDNWPGKNKNTCTPDPTPESTITPDDIDNSTTYIYNNKTGEVVITNNAKDRRRRFYYILYMVKFLNYDLLLVKDV